MAWHPACAISCWSRSPECRIPDSRIGASILSLESQQHVFWFLQVSAVNFCASCLSLPALPAFLLSLPVSKFFRLIAAARLLWRAWRLLRAQFLPRAWTLGWWYSLSDSLGRVGTIERLLNTAGLPSQPQTAGQIRQVLQRILARAPHWILVWPRVRSICRAYNLKCRCGHGLIRWKLLPATFFTLARGVLSGSI